MSLKRPVTRTCFEISPGSAKTLKIGDAFRASLPLVVCFTIAIFCCACFGTDAHASAYDFLKSVSPKKLFAIDPDLMMRRIDPTVSRDTWSLAEGWGLPPLYFHTKLPGLYDRVDFFYPLGLKEDSKFRSKLKLFPVFESYWSKMPPFDGQSRILTLFQGRSDLGQEYWGFFPFYGYTYRRFGVDHNFFLLFPFYYESTEDQARTIRFLWPIGTYANSPGRKSFKIWPIIGTDTIGDEYISKFILWPLLQKTERFPGTEQYTSYKALPFPLYVRNDTFYSTSTDILWPFFNYYHHYSSGFTRYTFRPFFSYGSGGGVEELSILYLYSYKKDLNKGTTSGSGTISISQDEVTTERSFLKMSTIEKRYRKGDLVYSKYKFWPFAEYVWDYERGSRFKFPNIVPIKNDFWDMNLGKYFTFVDFRNTPITRELSILFGLSSRTEVKLPVASIPSPRKPGNDDWADLILGSFDKR